MKKINENGFTLIELLAVIVIMGILMMVAIPAVSRTIENSRKDTFMDIAKSYADATKTLWSADGLTCTAEALVSSATDKGTYYVEINTRGYEVNDSGTFTTTAVTPPTLLDQGGKSSWGNRDVVGYVKVAVDVDGDKRTTKFYIRLSDGIHGVADDVESSSLTRGQVKTSGFGYENGIIPAGAYTCVES